MKIKYSIVLLSLITISCFSSCSGKEESTQPPNIVWITSEDNSKHYMRLFDEHGTEAPNIEKLAKGGITYTHAFSNAAVCSAARSTLISASYGPRLATNYHRKLQKVPMPDDVKMFPYYLKKAGYYTTNNAKEDYNIIKHDSVWDESSKKATWKNRNLGQPFFHVFNILTTHESRLHFPESAIKEGTKTNQDSCFIFPNHPKTELFKYTNARYRDLIKKMDAQVGQVVDELEADGLLENTFIFYFGDHGGVLPGSKGYINESGVHVPLVVYIPPKYRNMVDKKPGSKENGFVSFIDFGPTVLNLAGANIPEHIDGKPFLGKNITSNEVSKRDETFSYADRFDEKYDIVRAIRKGKYKYERNYQPFNYDGLMNNYRYIQLGYQEWKALYEAGKLNDIQSQFFETKLPESLYDVEADPYETNNLANNPEYAEVLEDLRSNLNERVKGMPDLSFYPEFYLINNAFDNPVAFGQAHKSEIASYVDIANLSLYPFDSIKDQLEQALNSSDPWKRYWALITCSRFNTEALSLQSVIEAISKTDDELINKVRAWEFLGLTRVDDPVKGMTDALYASKDSAEALLILNSMVLMKDDFKKSYTFNIDTNNMDTEVSQNSEVMRRLEYFNK
ncbi:sulfatase [Tamlana fucoidanivorans]|uniref:Sulfatase n=1 Tax=Allotamlana fucoidanivorans TaxID=2583814 RepID=A0A5C4SIJ9_9FLAO|nr:sulfatase [Tamlana fucoidanivorans]TNJ43438.1 sulfatase [Tamlana fucoidanivorans]